MATSETMMSLPDKNHVTRSSKSIDRICAKLQLNADGVSTTNKTLPTANQRSKFVDINDVINKQKKHSNIDTEKNFDINGNSVQSTTTQNCEVEEDRLIDCDEKMADEFSADEIPDVHIDQQNSVEYLLPADDSQTGNTASSDYSESCSENSQSIDIVLPAEQKTDESTPGQGDSNLKSTDQSKMADEEKNKVKPRHTTQYNNWHYTDMLKAINAVQSKNLSMTAAAKKYHIPRTTLRHYLNDGTNRDKRIDSFSLPRECEEELVHFVLEHHTTSEKVLYKMIFEKAKILSQLATKSVDKKRHAPTPAWIRRFVYRHKQLYDLFPTCLTRLEHPLHGGKKNTGRSEEGSVLEFENLPQDTSFAARDEIPRQSNGTEIIFPTFEQQRRPEQNTDEFAYENEHNQGSFEMRRHEEDRRISGVARSFYNGRQRHLHETVFKPSYNSFSGYSMAAEEEENREGYHTPTHTSQNTKIKEEIRERPEREFIDTNRFCDGIKTYKDASERYDTIGSHNSKSPIIHHPSKLEYHHSLDDNLKPKKRSHSDLFHPYSSSEKTPRHSLINLSSVSLLGSPSASVTVSPDSQARVHRRSTELTTEHLTNGFNESNMENISEIGMAKDLLDTMENRLGPDYVLLFQERYSRNTKMERLYSKWVQMKSMVECLENRLIK